MLPTGIGEAASVFVSDDGMTGGLACATRVARGQGNGADGNTPASLCDLSRWATSSLPAPWIRNQQVSIHRRDLRGKYGECFLAMIERVGFA